MTSQGILWGVMVHEKPKPRKDAGSFASGFVVHDDLFHLAPPSVVPIGAESVERKAARVRELEAREGRKV